jgi:hypothetical protein
VEVYIHVLTSTIEVRDKHHAPAALSPGNDLLVSIIDAEDAYLLALFLRNVGKPLPDYTTSYPREPPYVIIMWGVMAFIMHTTRSNMLKILTKYFVDLFAAKYNTCNPLSRL